MKKINFLILILMFISTMARSETIVIVGDKWCPFNCDPKSGPLGYMIDVAKIIFERKGHNIDYQVTSWVKGVGDVRNNRATALVAATKFDAPDFIYPNQSMGSNKDCFYVRAKDKWEFNEVDDLKSRKLGSVMGYAYSAAIVTYIDQNPKLVMTSEGTDPLKINIERLNNKTIDVIVENPFVFNYFVEKAKLADKFEEAGCTEDNDLFIAFSPKNPRSKEFAQILNSGLDELRKDGTLDKIVAKYSLKDWR